MHIVSIRFHMFFDDILLGKCSGITFAYICLHLKQIFVTFCDIWHGCKYITLLKKLSHPSHPFPAVNNDACVQVTFWQAGHKGMYDILLAVYELSPGNQVSSSIYAFAILCFLIFFVTILFKGYCMLMFTTFARQNKYWQWLKYVRYLHVTCSELQNLSNRTQGGRDT